MAYNRKSGHTLQQRRAAEAQALDAGSYYSEDTTSVHLPDGARVECNCPGNSNWKHPGAAQCTTYDKYGRVLEKRRYQR